MAAYAALVSLMHIIEQLQHHPRPPFYLDNEHAQCLIEKVTFLQDFLEDYSHLRNEQVDRLQSRIAEAAYAAEDVIETHVVDQILAQSTTHGEQISSVDFYQDLQKVIRNMDFIKDEVMENKEKMGSVPYNQQHRTRSVPAAASSRSSSTKKNTVVAFDDALEEIMDKLTRQQPNRQIVSIVGMGGIGKTTLAKTVYENSLIVEHFHIRRWATISQEYSVKEILLQLLHNQNSQKSFSQTSEEELGEMLYKSLCGWRYLIIMDDLWGIEAWDKLKCYFPQNNCGSGIIITSRLSNLAVNIQGASGIKISLLNDDRSWNLLCKTVFEEDGCPVELEKTGKKIAKKCEGLPLSLVVIGGLLRKSEQTPEYWECIAENLSSVVNLEDNKRCLNLLYMSYNYLPVHLKPCFLYMGVFSEDYTIRVSELIKLWVAEGFLKPISGKSLEDVGEEYLKALVDRNLVLVDKWTRNGKIKSCKMHDLLRDLCLREAEKDKFLCMTRLQSLNKFSQDASTPRRIAIYQSKSEEKSYLPPNYLPQIRDALQSAPLARSLICDNLKIMPPLNSRFLRILKVVDGFVRTEEMDHLLKPLFQLVNSRFIEVVGHSPAQIPRGPSSCLLWNLQTLVVNFPAYSHDFGMPFEIWKMPHLRHVDCFQFSLTNPQPDDFVLKNLRTLSCIINFNCGEEVVKRIPNVKKLGIFYRGMYERHPYCLNNLGCLHALKSLYCKIYPTPTWPGQSDLLHNLTLPRSLKKLTLEGKRCLHWEVISTKIGSLPLLQALTLDGELFMGNMWKTVEGQFPNLKFLMIHSSFHLEDWDTEESHFPRLEHLILRRVGQLKEIPRCIGYIPTLQRIELRGFCKDSAVDSAKKIAEEQEERGNEDLQVIVEILAGSKMLESSARHNLIVEVVPY